MNRYYFIFNAQNVCIASGSYPVGDTAYEAEMRTRLCPAGCTIVAGCSGIPLGLSSDSIDRLVQVTPPTSYTPSSPYTPAEYANNPVGFTWTFLGALVFEMLRWDGIGLIPPTGWTQNTGDLGNIPMIANNGDFTLIRSAAGHTISRMDVKQSGLLKSDFQSVPPCTGFHSMKPGMYPVTLYDAAGNKAILNFSVYPIVIPQALSTDAKMEKVLFVLRAYDMLSDESVATP